MGLVKISREWMLPAAIAAGISSYLIYHALPAPFHAVGPVLSDIAAILQPLLIFSMLFLTFGKIEPRELKPHRWHLWLLLIQGGSFMLLAVAAWAVIHLFPERNHDALVLVESAMLCFICPTATAAAVVTRRLGGDVPGITTYIVLINILAAVLVPVMVPLVCPVEGMVFRTAFTMILARVFPLLITPCLCAWLVRYLLPKVHRKLQRYPDLPFHLWIVALTLAMALTTKSVVRSDMPLWLMLLIAAVSLLCCVFQFAAGRYVGGRYKTDKESEHIRKVTAGQSLGQKNTVFAIWMGYTFMTPETAIVGGFYSIWHNLYNSWQLHRTETGKKKLS